MPILGFGLPSGDAQDGFLVCRPGRAAHALGDEANQWLPDQLNSSGRIFLTHTRLDDKLTLRLSIGQTNTRRRHVE